MQNPIKKDNKFKIDDLVTPKIALPNDYRPIIEAGSVCRIIDDGMFFEKKNYDIEVASDSSKYVLCVPEEDLDYYEER